MAKKENNKVGVSPSPQPSTTVEEFELIRWDKPTKIFLYILTGLFIFSVLLKIHTSSIPIWNQIANDGGNLKRGLIAGKPLTIRSDEWLVQTTFLLSQVENNFPLENPALGFGKTPLLTNLPTQSIFSYLRIQHWGFFLFDVERGFSWYMNIRFFGLILAVFLLLKIFTNNDFYVSLAGSIFTTFSSFLVWWSFHTEEILYSSLSLVLFLWILFDKKGSLVIIAIKSILFFLLLYNFAVILYPAYQIPIVYVLIFALLGFVYENFKKLKDTFTEKIRLKISCLTLSFICFFGIIIWFLAECKDTINVIMSTVYPGKRFEIGGEFGVSNIMREVFHIFVSENKFPPQWGNMSELSSSLMLSIAVVPILLFAFIQKTKISPTVILLVIINIFFWFWLLVGLPPLLAKITLLSFSPSYRTTYGLGFANCLLVFVFISKNENKFNNFINFIIVSILVIISIITVIVVNQSVESFFTGNQVLISLAIFAGLMILLFLSFETRFKSAFLIFTTIYSLHNLNANPVSVGLKPFYSNKLFDVFYDFPREEKQKGWVLFGQFTFSNYLKAAGLNLYSGVQFAPQKDKIKILDPTSKNDSTYNRYAHISFYPLISQNDSVDFKLIQSDSYAIQIDPCSPRFKQMGIKYIVFAYQPQPVEVRNLTLVSSNGLFIYKNDL